LKKPKAILAAIGIVLFLIVGWNMAWRYDTAVINGRQSQVRTHMITGKAERLTSYGWLPLGAY